MAEEASVKGLKKEIADLREDIRSHLRTIRELNVQIEAIRQSEEAHIARNPWKRGVVVGPKRHVVPGEGDY